MLNLDTHILIHAAGGTLTKAERKVLEADDWSISAVVLWEIEMLYARKRITLSLDQFPLVDCLHRMKTWPITSQVCLRLRDLDFKSDPVNEIIAATSLAHDLPMVTRDTRIRTSKVLRFCPNSFPEPAR